jgi:hypothetical protein
MDSPSVVVPVSGLKATYPPASVGESTAVSSIGLGLVVSVAPASRVRQVARDVGASAWQANFDPGLPLAKVG